MPRQRNTKPTLIYWLHDMRPETIAAGWPNGKPFYCGKTVEGLTRRLHGHRTKAAKKPFKILNIHILKCGKFIHATTMEVVPAAQDWCARERFWIYTQRLFWPDCCLNVSDGGEGPAGLIHSEETRAKISIANRGRKLSPETRAKMSAAMLGKVHEKTQKYSPETRAKMSESKKGRKLSPETRAKISAARLGTKRSLEARANMSAAQRRSAALRASAHVATSPTSNKRSNWTSSTSGAEMLPELIWSPTLNE